MGDFINEKSTRAQSLNAYNQWCVQWREHAKHHAQYKQKSFEDFQGVGTGKALLAIGNGASFEEEIETIKTHQSNVDILVCDKALGHCIDNGITPTYVMVCDANVNYEKYMEPWKDKLKDTILFSNVCGNIKWTKPEYWKDVYFFVNEDVIESEKEFSKLSGCKNIIPAATNVSGEMIVLLFQSNNHGRQNLFGYDKVLLVGFDYSWEADGNYYAFNKTGDGKHNYMRHITGVNQRSKLCFTSTNLFFSMEWLKKYVTTFNLPVVNCGKSSILDIPKRGSLSEQMQYNYKSEDKFIVSELIKRRLELRKQLNSINSKLHTVARDHHFAYLASV